MTIGSALVIIALALLVAGFIARPLFTGLAREVSEAERHRSELLAARDRTLSGLADLDMDMALEKIPEADYNVHRAELVQQGADILREIDALNGESPAEQGYGPEDAELEGQLEAAVAQLRTKPDTGLEAEMEAAVARLRENKAAGRGGFCPRCGKAVASDDRFCTHCGASLENRGSAS
jgi:zinc-ribbon domain